jgi:hypothetical protein
VCRKVFWRRYPLLAINLTCRSATLDVPGCMRIIVCFHSMDEPCSYQYLPFVGPVGHSVIPTPMRPRPCSCSGNICREKPGFAGKVTCGFRSETSGQSWPSNTVATESVHRAKPEFKMWQRHPAQTSERLEIGASAWNAGGEDDFSNCLESGFGGLCRQVPPISQPSSSVHPVFSRGYLRWRHDRRFLRSISLTGLQHWAFLVA